MISDIVSCRSVLTRLVAHVRGMIAGEVLFHEQPTLLSVSGALMICCVAVGVTLFENRSQEPRKEADVDTELGSVSAHTDSELAEKRPLVAG